MIDQSKKKRKRSSFSSQVIALIVLGAVCLALAATLITVNILTAIRKFPYGDETYYIIRQKDENGKTTYIMTDGDREPLEKTKDDYFILKDGTLIELDQTTGNAKEYIPVDTEGNEQVGINDRVLIFPHTSKDRVQSIEVYNPKGDFSFYRMRVYEDTDKISYLCLFRDGEYYLVDEEGENYEKGDDGLYELKSGNKIYVDENSGNIRTQIYYDFDGRAYTVKKNADGEYRLYDEAGKEVTATVSKTGEKTDSEGKKYETELYRYVLTAHGTLISVDEKYGTLGIWAVREYNAAKKAYATYYFLCRNGKYMLAGEDGKIITNTAVGDSSYYRTGNNAYLAFNEENGSYSVRVRNGYYIIRNNDGVYSFYNKDKLLQPNGSGYYILPDNSYLNFDAATASFSLLTFNGESYVETDSKYLNATVNTDAEGRFVIEGYETTEYDPSLFSALIVSGGYTLTAKGGKLSEPILLRDANGEPLKTADGASKVDFAAYGLTECIRVDETGKEYLYTPAYYIIKDIDGNAHKITVGDKIISGAGFYIKYEGLNETGEFEERQAVYILLDNYSTGYTQTYEVFYYYSITDTLLASVESIVTPMVIYPMSMNSYFDVSNFTLLVYNAEKSRDVLLNDDPEDDTEYYDTLVKFSFVDLDERLNTALASFPYVMEKGCDLYGYYINSYAVDACLLTLKDLKPLGVSHLGVDDQDMVRYGLDVPRYVIYYKTPINGVEDSQMLMISALTPNDTYYVYTPLYDMIVEIESTQLPFLTWRTTEWLSTDFYDIGVGFADSLRIESGDYWANFDIFMSHTLSAKITTSGSSNFTHAVYLSADKKDRILSLSASINANVGSSGSTGLMNVEFETLELYYRYVDEISSAKSNSEITKVLHANGVPGEEIQKLINFVDTIYQHDEEGSQAITIHSMTLSSSNGGAHEVSIIFMFEADGEITVAISVNKESPCPMFSKKAYLAYERHIFGDETLTAAEKKTAFDFYLSRSVSASSQVDFEKVIGTNSLGQTTIYTNEAIVRTDKDGNTVTDYALGRDYRIFFDVGEEDLIGVSNNWIRFYDMSDPATSTGDFVNITDKTYTFKSSLVRLILPKDGGGSTVIKEGSLGAGEFTVTVTEAMVIVEDAEGNTTRYLRYTGTAPFSSFYSSILWADYEGYCDIPEEQKKAFRESDDSACQMKLTIKTKMNTTYEFRTYKYSERRSYITANGSGDFFVLRSFVDKIVGTSSIIFDGTNISPTDKYS